MARSVRRVGLAQVHAREPGTEPAQDGARVRRHLLLAPLRPRHAARGDDGRARHGGASGQGTLRRHLVLLGAQDARGGGDLARARHAAGDPPTVVLDVQPLDRGRVARHARGRRNRVHRVLAARAGHAHRPVPRRDPRGFARQPARNPLAGSDHRRDAREDPRTQRDRAGPGTDARAARARVDATGPTPHVGALRGNGSTSRATSWRKSTATPPRAGSTSGLLRAPSDQRHDPFSNGSTGSSSRGSRSLRKMSALSSRSLSASQSMPSSAEASSAAPIRTISAPS